MKRIGLGVAALLLPASAQAITVAEWLVKADALKAKGMRAMFSSDLKPTFAELKTATAAWRADRAARKAAGQPPLACPPERSRMKLDDFLASLHALPSAEQQLSLGDGFARMVVRRYPCR